MHFLSIFSIIGVISKVFSKSRDYIFFLDFFSTFLEVLLQNCETWKDIVSHSHIVGGRKFLKLFDKFSGGSP